MAISQEIRDFAANNPEAARAMEDKATEFRAMGSTIYVRAD
jgi:hypothetical protein